MSLELFLYLVSVLDRLDNAIYGYLIVSVAFIVFCVIGGLMSLECDDEDSFKKCKKYINVTLISLLILLPLKIMIPSKTTMYAMGISYAVKQIQIPQKVMDLLNQKLDDSLGGEKL